MTTLVPRVLLVDDEKSIREPLADYLRANHGYDIVAVTNGYEAWQRLEAESGRFDVALVDAVLEDGPDGLAILRRIKAIYPDIEVILFTGWGLTAGLDALRAGAYRYFAKPFNPEELALTIRFAAEQGFARRQQNLLTASGHRIHCH